MLACFVGKNAFHCGQGTGTSTTLYYASLLSCQCFRSDTQYYATSPSESVTAGHDRILKSVFHQISFPKKGRALCEIRCRVESLSRPCALNISISPFPMSDSSQGDESQSFSETSDNEGSSAFSLASHPQRTAKRSRDERTMGRAWFLRGEIKTHLLPTDSDDAKFQRIQSH